MSRKHFVKLAEAIRLIENEDERKRTAQAIGAVCAECNPHFNWYTWRAACGVN